MIRTPLNLLLADDDEDDCLFFKEALEDLSVESSLTTVNNGEQLMRELNTSTERLPDIIFLDLNMPRKNGIECLSEIKQMEHLKDMAVAIYSTSASETDIEETFVKGANVYIKKPNNFDDLIKTLNTVTTFNWQYHTNSLLNKDTFLLRI